MHTVIRKKRKRLCIYKLRNFQTAMKKRKDWKMLWSVTGSSYFKEQGQEWLVYMFFCVSFSLEIRLVHRGLQQVELQKAFVGEKMFLFWRKIISSQKWPIITILKKGKDEEKDTVRRF